MSPSPTTKGGVMMGSIARMLSARAPRRPPRSAISAISVPRSVVLAAVASPSTMVFHATPQRTPPEKQPSPKLRSLKMRPAKDASGDAPSSPMKAPASALATG
ncbi:MAG: hypothetical protein K0R89_2877 [Ramlibacter sp.]|nr:hypothetical protein [Ramlibacter sp.]